MPESILERYERILRADPGSRIFVELARALLDRGEPARAAETCARGVQHHPDSIVARILWAKALLALGRPDEASVQLDAATDIDLENPYAYDLAGEALVAAGEPARALALLARGAQRHPRDPRIQLWVERASMLAERGAPERGENGASSTPSSLPPPLPRTPTVAAPPPANDPALVAAPDEIGAAAQKADAPVPPAVDEDGSAVNEPLGLVRAATGNTPGAAPAPPMGVTTDAFPDAAIESAALALHATSPFQESGPEPVADRPDERSAIDVAGGAVQVIPHEAAPPHDAAPPPDAHETPHPTQQPASPPLSRRVLGWARRHVRVLAIITLVLASSVGVATFLVVRNREGVADARSATEAARAGLARDTLGSLRQAASVLSRARRTAPHDPEPASLLAEVSALLAHDFGDGDARGAARGALASASAGRGTYATRWLVALAAERDEAVGPLLANRDATPLASTVAGQVLLSLGDLEGARASLERASKERPPMLRAITLLGDLELAAGELAAARDRYQSVLRIQATHPRAAIGMAEVSLATGLELPEALQALEKVSADRESTVPLQDRLRFDLVRARLLARNGRAGEALPILDEAAQAPAGRAEIAAARADVLAASGDLPGAIAAARTALEHSRGDARYRELIAELQLRHGRYRDLLAGTQKDPTRALRTYRSRARLALGDIPGARAEIEATRRDGKMTPEAAAWAALVEIAAGRSGAVTGVVDALLEQPLPQPAALVARGRLDLQGGRQSSAEHHLREAMGRDPDLLEARIALSELLLEANRTAEALELTRATVARAPSRGTGRVALARALLASGQRKDAIAELVAVLSNAPEDPPAEAAARQLLRTMRPKPRPAAQ